MESRKAIKMLIARYKADAGALAKREKDLLKEIETIENLIPTITISYMSKIQGRENAQDTEIKEAKEKLERLQNSLVELEQSIQMIRGEENVMKRRIEELEISLNNKPDPYSNEIGDNKSLEDSDSADVVVYVRKSKDSKDSSVAQELKTEISEAGEEDSGKPTNKHLSNTVPKTEKPSGIFENSSLETDLKQGKDKDKKIQETEEQRKKIPTETEHTNLVQHSNALSSKTERQSDLEIAQKAIKGKEQEDHKTQKSKDLRKYIHESTDSNHPDLKGKANALLSKTEQPSDVENSPQKAKGRLDHKIQESRDQVAKIHEPLGADPTNLEQSISTIVQKSENPPDAKQNSPYTEEREDKKYQKSISKTVPYLKHEDVDETNLEPKKCDPETEDPSDIVENIPVKGERIHDKDHKIEGFVDKKEKYNKSVEGEKNNPKKLEGSEHQRKILQVEDTNAEQLSDRNTSINDTQKTGEPSGILGEYSENETFKTERKSDTKQVDLKGNKLEQLLQAKDNDWKKVYDNLSFEFSKMKESLENSSQKLKESQGYVKRLEEACNKLEKELQDKITLLRGYANTEDKKLFQSNENKDTLGLMQEALTKTRSFRQSLHIPPEFQMGEIDGVTPAYMQLAHWRFALKLPEYQGDRELKEKLINGIKQGNMAPYYKEVCEDLGWEFDSKLFDEMSAANVKRLEELEKEHENNVMDEEDQSQLCGVWQSKLDYLCSIGDKENASALANSKVDDKTVPKSHRIDAVFALFRISFFHGCNIKGMSTAIEKATELIEGISGGDWSARNKLKAYEGVWSLAIRDFTRAAHLFVDVVPTFESYELADFGTIIRYTVLSCMIALPRCDLRKKLMLHGVMAQALHSQYQDLREYFVSLYDGRYSDFLVCLARIEVEMKRDPLLHPHYRHYVQEMRLRAYKQILQAYRSLSLDYMAQSFGVTSEFIEREVARFAAAGRLQCKIDSVAGTVITSAHLDDSVRSKEAPEASQDRNILYQTTVKRGDILLNRLKKLARVMDF